MPLNRDQQAIVADVLAAGADLRRHRALDFYEPYLKQLEFHRLGATKTERALIAANQVGKSHCGAGEDAYHLTGQYPSWWKGHRFDHPPVAWLVGPDQKKVRDTLQSVLFGPWDQPDAFGTGFLPLDTIVGRPTLGHGVSGAFSNAVIRWKPPNGRLDESAKSTVALKSYTESLLSFAASAIDLVHEDEEAPGDIHGEIKVRLQVKRGIRYMTLTPLLGYTEMITQLLKNPLPHQAVVKMGMYDAMRGHDPARPYLGHYLSKEQVDAEIAGFQPHLRGARAYGDPALGEGKVFLVPEQLYTMQRPDFIPPHWRKIWGIDFGGAGENSHPFAAVLLAHDLDFDTVYLLHVLKLHGMSILQHVPKMREIAPGVPVAWPHDGNEVDRGGSGLTLAEQYRNPMPGMPGLNMLPEHATWETGGFSTDAAVVNLDNRMQTGRFKAFDDQPEFHDEVRQFHKKDFKYVRINDDILSALFKGLMMLREAKPGYLHPPKVGKYERKTDEWWKPKGRVQDFDPWTGQPVSTQEEW